MSGQDMDVSMERSSTQLWTTRKLSADINFRQSTTAVPGREGLSHFNSQFVLKKH